MSEMKIIGFTVSTEDPGLSEEIDLRGYTTFALEMSTTWSASAITVLAANMGAQAGSTTPYLPLNFSGAAQELAVSASNVYDLSTMGLAGVCFVRFRSSEEQAAPRRLKLSCK